MSLNLKIISLSGAALKGFSKTASQVSESVTLSITALVKKLISEGKDVLSYSAGEPDFPTPQYIKDAAYKAIQENFTRYTPNKGIPDLLEAIIHKFKTDNGLDYTAANLLVSNGAKQSIFNLVMAACNPGDEIVFQAPYWLSYPEMAKIAGAVPVAIPSDARNDFKITAAEIEKAITPKTKLIILNSPSNPTGAVYTEDEVREIAEVLRDKELYIISDEIYEKILFDGYKHFSIAQIDGFKDKTVIVNGVSKAYSMTGWRIGYAAGPKDLITVAGNVQSHATSSSCSISQKAAATALSGPQDEVEMMRAAFEQRRNYLIRELQSIDGVICPMPRGAFYAYFDVSHYYNKSAQGFNVTDSVSMCEYLIEKCGVALVPGAAFGDDHTVRMSFACSMDSLTEGVKRIRKGLSELN